MAGDVERNPGPNRRKDGPSCKLNVISWNCRTISNKMEFIGHILSKLDPDVLCLQETSCRMALFHWNYVCYRRDRPGRGGGLITLIKRGIQHDCFDISIPSMRGTVESMGVRINEDVSILNIYSPPSSRINFELFSLKRVGKFILAGDFNAHHRIGTGPRKPT